MKDSTKMNPGFFSIEDTRKVESLPLPEAKAYALERIKAQTGARPHNITKASDMVNRATSVKSLMLGMANFVLAHPSEGLGLGSSPSKK